MKAKLSNIKSKNKRFVSISLAVLMSASTIIMPAITTNDKIASIFSVEANAATGRAFNQWDSKWKSKCNFGTSGSLYKAGCGVFAFANAIYSLNGKVVDVTNVATVEYNNKYWSPTSGVLNRSGFFNTLNNKFSSTYNFKIKSQNYGNIESSTLINHLKNGGVAVAHVYSHFIAIVGYNSANKTYHVIESAVSNSRGLSSDSFVSASKLKSGKTKVDWFALISSTSTPVTPTTSYFPRYTGSSTSIVTGLKAVGSDSSYSYRCKIAEANGIYNYKGTASQNTDMLNKLKSGTLKKPNSSTSNSSKPAVSYFPRYTGSSTSIVTGLKAVGSDSSYSYRCKIAEANGIYNYKGTASQNTDMLNKLKAGNLKRP